jgi:hypothetical protein
MKVLRDPLFHFAVAGLAIFLLYGWINSARDQRNQTITVSNADMERMAALYAAEAGTLPSPEDIHAMVADHVRNEALTREARRLGLDQGDTVVERRLAQKMTFMIADLNEQGPPSDQDLQNWFDTHASVFERPAQMTFQHVYFSDPTDPKISSTLNALNGDTPPDWKASGDPFMLQRQYADLPAREVARIFGVDFSKALFSLDNGAQWQGPVHASLGTFLIRVQAKDAAQMPRFETVRDAVTEHYTDANRRAQNDQAVADLVAKYKVEIEGVSQ